MAAAWTRGELRPVIHATFPLRDAALRTPRSSAGEHVGKIVLTVVTVGLSSSAPAAGSQALQRPSSCSARSMRVHATARPRDAGSERRTGDSRRQRGRPEVRQARDEGRGQRERQSASAPGPSRPDAPATAPCQRRCRRLRRTPSATSTAYGRHAVLRDAPQQGRRGERQRERLPQHEDDRQHAPHVTPRTTRARRADRRAAASASGSWRRVATWAKRRSTSRNAGSASAASAAAVPKAAAEAGRGRSTSRSIVEPAPMPVSNAARIAPNAAPRRLRRHPASPRPRTRDTPCRTRARRSRPRPMRPARVDDSASAATPIAMTARLGRKIAPVADPIAEAARERPRHQRDQRQRRQVDRLRPDAERVGVHRAEAADRTVAVRVEEERRGQRDDAPLDAAAVRVRLRMPRCRSSTIDHAIAAIIRLSTVVTAQSQAHPCAYTQKPDRRRDRGGEHAGEAPVGDAFAASRRRAGRRSGTRPTRRAATTRRCRGPARAPAAGGSSAMNA